MDYDVTLAAQRRRGGLERPSYQDEKGVMCLAWLNFLLHCFELLGFQVVLRGRKHFTFQLNFLGHRKGFVFFVDDSHLPPIQRKAQRQTYSRTYCFRWDRETSMYGRGESHYVFEAIKADCIKQIVMDVVMHDEAAYRDSVVSAYKWRVQRRQREIERREEEIQRAAENKRKALEVLLRSRIDMMSTAFASMNYSDQIRTLIAAMQVKSESAKQPIKDLERWVRWASHHANTIDPRHMSAQGFEAWIGKFKLKH